MDIIRFLKDIKFDFLRKRMRVGVSYNVFDGEELLEFSIKTIRKSVQHINIVYQTVSNLGNPSNPDLEEKLKKLKNEGLIDEIYHYNPDLKVSPHQNEQNKRDIGLKIAKKDKCNYFMSMDADEFYDEEQFRLTLDKIVRSNINTSAVRIIEYLKEPDNQIVAGYTFVPDGFELYDFCVPFVIKINKFINQKHGQGYFSCSVDPTRKLFHNGRFKLFPMQEIVMHHMSTIRKDLNKKYSNSSLMDSSEDTQKSVKWLQEQILAFDFDNCKTLPEDCAIFRKNIVRKVPNKFNIEL